MALHKYWMPVNGRGEGTGEGPTTNAQGFLEMAKIKATRTSGDTLLRVLYTCQFGIQAPKQDPQPPAGWWIQSRCETIVGFAPADTYPFPTPTQRDQELLLAVTEHQVNAWIDTGEPKSSYVKWTTYGEIDVHGMRKGDGGGTPLPVCMFSLGYEQRNLVGMTLGGFNLNWYWRLTGRVLWGSSQL